MAWAVGPEPWLLRVPLPYEGITGIGDRAEVL